MRLEYDEAGDLDVYVRQSWIKEAMMCPERGRNGIIRGDWSNPSELSAIGTGVHASIEAFINGSDTSLAIGVGCEAYDEQMAMNGRNVRMTDEAAKEYIPTLFRNWREDILPLVRGEILGVEEKFSFLLDEFKIGTMNVRVHGVGTIDLVTSEQMWDWKTAARKYNLREKQDKDVQSTMYAAAVAQKYGRAFPLEFNFGVLVRDGGTQQVTVERTASDVRWLAHVVQPLVRQAVFMGTNDPWPVNDTHYLCNATWCPFWTVCKGAM